MFTRLAVVVLLFSALAACTDTPKSAADMLNTRADGRGFITRTYAGRTYALFVPLSYNEAVRYPVIVFLHGIGEGGANIRAPLTVGIGPFVAAQVGAASDFGFIVVFPQSADGIWDETRDGPVVRGIVRDVTGNYSVDEDRVALTGISTGGYGTWAIGATYPQVFSALVPMASYAAYTGKPETLARMNIWAFDNFGDPFGGMGANDHSVAAVTAAGGHPRHTTYPGFMDHNCWDKAYREPELFTWLRKTRRPRAGDGTANS